MHFLPTSLYIYWKQTPVAVWVYLAGNGVAAVDLGPYTSPTL